MRKLFFIQILGAVMGGLNIAGPLILDAEALFPNWNWQYHALIGFVVFAGFMIWMVIDAKLTASKLIDTRPTISVETIEENNTYYLKVKNNGAEGTFRVQIELISDDPSIRSSIPLKYYGCWKLGNKVDPTILKGHANMIKLAEKVLSSGVHSVSFHFFYYSEPSAREASISSSDYHFDGYIKHLDGSTQPCTEYKYKLGVTISSSPSLREDTYQSQYLLDSTGIEVNANP